MRISSVILTAAASVVCCAANAHLPPPGDDGSHPGGTLPGGPIKPRFSNSIGDYELVDYRGGIPSFHSTVVFWGSKWSNQGYMVDRVKGLDEFYTWFDRSTYSASMLEYFPSSASISGASPLSIGYVGYVIDLNPSDDNGLLGAAQEICVDLRNGLIPAEGIGSWEHYFSVFTDKRRPKGAACGINGAYTDCAPTDGDTSLPFYISLIYDPSDDPNCSIHDPETRHSDAVASMANQAARAIAELHTDPQWNGWHDNNGDEIDDKCAWIFDVPYVTFENGSRWKLQSLWSNRAFEAGTGSLNREGEPGCVSHPPLKTNSSP